MKKPRSSGELQLGTQLFDAHTHFCVSRQDCWMEYYRNAGNNLFWYGVLIGAAVGTGIAFLLLYLI